MKKIAYLLSIGLMCTLLGCTAPSVSPKNQPEITMDEFDKIKNGMTYEQVTAIIGSPGEIVAETGSPSDPFYTITYYFIGTSDLWNDSNAHLTFQNGRLHTKAQTGLKRPDSPI